MTSVRALHRVENSELRDRPRLVEATPDAHAGRGAAVAIEMFVAPDLGALVQPRTDAVGIVPMREEDGRHFDLPADRPLEHLAHLGRGAGGVARVHDDPAARGLDGIAARDSPAPQSLHAVDDLLGNLRLRDAPQRIGLAPCVL